MLSVRILSVIALLPVVVFFAWYGGFLFAILIGIVAALALNEFSRMMERQGDHPLRALGGGATALLILNGLGMGETLLPAAIALVLFGGLVQQLASEVQDVSLRGWALTVAGVFYIGWPLSLAVAIRGLPGEGFGALSLGLWWVVIVATATWGCDSGAYFAGRFLGGKLSGGQKFSPRWSPNKSWEGVVGGILTSVLAVTLLGRWLVGLPLWQGILLGALIGIACVTGDLAESMVKRRVGVKDSGDLIPGHGGMLDRIDSTLFTTVVAYFFIVWVVY